MKLKIYIYSASIRNEKIGDVQFIMASTSKKGFVDKILKTKYARQRFSRNWINQRVSILDDVPTPYRKLNWFNPFKASNVLYMFETAKIEKGQFIVSRKLPKHIYSWN